ncbi:hypothetical protein [Gottfriedia acidiceleris]|uniref:Uncharacterized protein n=1 Tax=Gottfriedia acidiceleris TaxID=371036 RepID=A0ABY4JFG1_9BACI|nr:hypothetical protein [Gottfriedia acidiceleris]UPM52558.1 hypothetical protein MY490_11975 [Gottfriedia acidiceleris]
MKPKSEKYSDGFDYKMRLEVLETNEIFLPGGSVLEVKTDYPPTERLVAYVCVTVQLLTMYFSIEHLQVEAYHPNHHLIRRKIGIM